MSLGFGFKSCTFERNMQLWSFHHFECNKNAHSFPHNSPNVFFLASVKENFLRFSDKKEKPEKVFSFCDNIYNFFLFFFSREKLCNLVGGLNENISKICDEVNWVDWDGVWVKSAATFERITSNRSRVETKTNNFSRFSSPPNFTLIKWTQAVRLN